MNLEQNKNQDHLACFDAAINIKYGPPLIINELLSTVVLSPQPSMTKKSQTPPAEMAGNKASAPYSDITSLSTGAVSRETITRKKNKVLINSV